MQIRMDESHLFGSKKPDRCDSSFLSGLLSASNKNSEGDFDYA
jgi:hypothetical protein